MLEENNLEEPSASTPTYNRWLLVAALVFLVTTLVTIGLLVSQRREARQLASGYDQMSVALSQTRGQLDAMTAKLNALSTPPSQPAETEVKPESAPPATTAPEAAAPKAKHKAHKAAKRAPAEDPRWKQVQAELADHQKQIEANQKELASARTDLEGKLSSTRDELNGSIARNHDELVALQKRGERNYFEFDLDKSKQFNRTGPLSISLRKVNTKHQFCDLELIVDDNQISKKHVNIYEPMLLYPSDYGQPLEVVINQISKDEARGYVSVPKFRQSELAAGAQANQPSGQQQSSAQQPSASTASLEHRPTSSLQ